MTEVPEFAPVYPNSGASIVIVDKEDSLVVSILDIIGI